MAYYGFEDVKVSGDTARASCKIHNGNNPTSFVVNTDIGMWYCHSGDCGGGDIIALVMKMENISYRQAIKRIEDLFKVNVGLSGIAKSKQENEVNKWIQYMKSKVNVAKHSEYTLNASNIKNINRIRDFKKETIDAFGVYFAGEVTLINKQNSPYKLYNRIVFPIICDEKQVGVSLRKTSKDDFPKWLHQPKHIQVSKLLYNYDSVKGNDVIVVVEGAYDVMAFYEIGIPACAVFGSSISKQQYRMLMKTGADLVFAFDGDNAGRKALHQAKAMFKNKANISYIYFNEGEDSESISREELYIRYKERKKLI